MKKIAIASGKGGTGKTFFSTNLFHTMKEHGYRVILVDCDAEVPNDTLFIHGEVRQVHQTKTFCPDIDIDNCTFCNRCTEHCHFHAITCIPAMRYIKVMPDLCHGCTFCLHECEAKAILPQWKTIGEVTAYGNGTQTTILEARIHEGEHSPVAVIRDAIHWGESLDGDFLLLDAPPGCSCPFVNTIMDADMVLLISEPTPFGLSDMQHSIHVLQQLNKPYAVIINRSDISDSQTRAFLAKRQIDIWGEIPYSKDIAVHYSEGELAVEYLPELEELFTNILYRLTTHENSHHQRKRR